MSLFPPKFLAQYSQYVRNPPTECFYCGEPLSTHYYNVPITFGTSYSSMGRIRYESFDPTSIARCEKCYQIHKLRDSLSFDHFYWKNPYYLLFLLSVGLCVIPFLLFIFVSNLALLLLIIPIILCYIGAKRIKNWNEKYREKAGLSEPVREAEKLHPNCKGFIEYLTHPLFTEINTVKYQLTHTLTGPTPKYNEIHGKHSF